MNIHRFISYYKKYSDDYVGNFTLPHIPLKELQSIFGIHNKKDLMYEVFKIENYHATFFIKKINIFFDFENYEYFLESEAI